MSPLTHIPALLLSLSCLSVISFSVYGSKKSLMLFGLPLCFLLFLFSSMFCKLTLYKLLSETITSCLVLHCVICCEVLCNVMLLCVVLCSALCRAVLPCIALCSLVLPYVTLRCFMFLYAVSLLCIDF